MMAKRKFCLIFVPKSGHMEDNFEDIINLPHHVSPNHPQMSMRNRAGQFAPFAALTGHDDAIRKTAIRHEDDMIKEEEDKKINPEYE